VQLVCSQNLAGGLALAMAVLLYIAVLTVLIWRESPCPRQPQEFTRGEVPDDISHPQNHDRTP
jgi:hypothetical protein